MMGEQLRRQDRLFYEFASTIGFRPIICRAGSMRFST